MTQTLLALFLAAWTALSIPAALLCGAYLHWCEESDPCTHCDTCRARAQFARVEAWNG